MADRIYWTAIVLLVFGLQGGVVQGQATSPVPATLAEPALLEELHGSSQELAQLRRKGKDEQALTRAEQLLAKVHNQVLQPHPDLATFLNELGRLYYSRGDYRQAEPLFRDALQMRKTLFSLPHPDIAEVLNDLAALYYSRQDYERAVPLFEQALKIQKAANGPEHPAVARTLNNLAAVYYGQEDYEKAEPLYQEALRIRRQTLDPTDPDIAESLNNLGVLYDAKGELSSAEALLEEALYIHEQALGPHHPNIATSLYNLALLYRANGKHEQAIGTLDRAITIREQNLSLMLATGSEDQKRAYVALLTADIDAAVTLHADAAPDDPQALQLALTTVLRRKGRVLDAMLDTMANLRRQLKPKDRGLFDQLAQARGQLAEVVLNGPSALGAQSYQERLADLTQQIQTLESQVGSLSAAFRSQLPSTSIDQVQGALPANSALVEFVVYRPFLPQPGQYTKRWQPARYMAYILPYQGKPAWVDVGEVTDIDPSVQELRQALSNPQNSTYQQLAQELDKKLMRPVREQLSQYTEDIQTVFLSPDGALHVLPFGALIDEGGRYLIESSTFAYLTAGREIVRFHDRYPAQDKPTVLANPAFGTVPDVQGIQQAAATRPPTVRSAILPTGLQFGPLPGTAVEAEALAGLLDPDVTVLTGTQATEAAVKALHGPRLLHLATHGFFSPASRETPLVPGQEVILKPPGKRQTDHFGAANPLLRSGLALAGANQRQRTPPNQGGEDGVLTALEAAGLDLWGTQLVVLSACETGMGEVQNREGVYGLRRALAMAGAESLVMSLWKVGDAATQALMVDYYERLLSNQGRAAGLRQAQLTMLQDSQWRHPFYWAGFILSGNWTPLGEFDSAE